MPNEEVPLNTLEINMEKLKKSPKAGARKKKTKTVRFKQKQSPKKKRSSIKKPSKKNVPGAYKRNRVPPLPKSTIEKRLDDLTRLMLQNAPNVTNKFGMDQYDYKQQNPLKKSVPDFGIGENVMRYGREPPMSFSTIEMSVGKTMKEVEVDLRDMKSDMKKLEKSKNTDKKEKSIIKQMTSALESKTREYKNLEHRGDMEAAQRLLLELGGLQDALNELMSTKHVVPTKSPKANTHIQEPFAPQSPSSSSVPPSFAPSDAVPEVHNAQNPQAVPPSDPNRAPVSLEKMGEMDDHVQRMRADITKQKSELNSLIERIGEVDAKITEQRRLQRQKGTSQAEKTQIKNTLQALNKDKQVLTTRERDVSGLLNQLEANLASVGRLVGSGYFNLFGRGINWRGGSQYPQHPPYEMGQLLYNPIYGKGKGLGKKCKCKSKCKHTKCSCPLHRHGGNGMFDGLNDRIIPLMMIMHGYSLPEDVVDIVNQLTLEDINIISNYNNKNLKLLKRDYIDPLHKQNLNLVDPETIHFNTILNTCVLDEPNNEQYKRAVDISKEVAKLRNLMNTRRQDINRHGGMGPYASTIEYPNYGGSQYPQHPPYEMGQILYNPIYGKGGSNVIRNYPIGFYGDGKKKNVKIENYPPGFYGGLNLPVGQAYRDIYGYKEQPTWLEDNRTFKTDRSSQELKELKDFQEFKKKQKALGKGSQQEKEYGFGGRRWRPSQRQRKIYPRMKPASKITDFLLPAEMPSGIKKFVETYKDVPIIDLDICRTPIPAGIEVAANLITKGDYNKKKLERDIDKFFHLFMVITLANGKRFVYEKNQRVTLFQTTKELTGEAECHVNVPVKKVPFGEMIQKGIKHAGADAYFRYDSLNNNCQKFVEDNLKPSGMWNDTIAKFVKQDVTDIVPRWVESGLKGATNLAGLVERIVGHSPSKKWVEGEQIEEHPIKKAQRKEKEREAEADDADDEMPEPSAPPEGSGMIRRGTQDLSKITSKPLRTLHQEMFRMERILNRATAAQSIEEREATLARSLAMVRADPLLSLGIDDLEDTFRRNLGLPPRGSGKVKCKCKKGCKHIKCICPKHRKGGVGDADWMKKAMLSKGRRQSKPHDPDQIKCAVLCQGKRPHNPFCPYHTPARKLPTGLGKPKGGLFGIKAKRRDKSRPFSSQLGCTLFPGNPACRFGKGKRKRKGGAKTLAELNKLKAELSIRMEELDESEEAVDIDEYDQVVQDLADVEKEIKKVKKTQGSVPSAELMAKLKKQLKQGHGKKRK
jgi:hypothetical protein